MDSWTRVGKQRKHVADKQDEVAVKECGVIIPVYQRSGYIRGCLIWPRTFLIKLANEI